MYQYAIAYKIVDKDCSTALRINAPADEKHGTPFSEEKYFQGGVKTVASKNRIVPIHSGIYDLVCRRMRRDKKILKPSLKDFRENMYATLQEIGIERHTPHDCRHTFSPKHTDARYFLDS